MKRLPRISETEWQIMKLLWARAPRKASDIIAELSLEDNWHPRTIKTYLARLVRKGALGFEQEGRAYLYRPLVSERECVSAVSQGFLDRVFGGSLSPLLAHFVQNKKLSAKELAEMRRILGKTK